MKLAGETWVIGVQADARGIVAAAVRVGGLTLLALGPGAARGWTGAERAALAGPSGPAREMFETAVATMAAGLALPAPAALLVAEVPAPGAAPALLAEVTGLPVAHDLAEADLRLGGAGHPITARFADALARHLGLDTLTLLELGARATLVQARPELGVEGGLRAFDAGPGLALLPVPGRGGRKRQGRVRTALLARWLAEPHFARMPPKALGPGDFADLPAALAALPPADAAATLRALVAEAVAQGVAALPARPDRLIVHGPGATDAGTLQRLARALPCPVLAASAAGLSAELLAAQALAYTGACAAQGHATSFPGTTGVAAAVGGAALSAPGALAVQARGMSNPGGASTNPSN